MSHSSLNNLHTLGSRFLFSEADKYNNSNSERGKQREGNV